MPAAEIKNRKIVPNPTHHHLRAGNYFKKRLQGKKGGITNKFCLIPKFKNGIICPINF
jgi:hypothetical protein